MSWVNCVWGILTGVMAQFEQIHIDGFKNLNNLHITGLKKINYFIGASGAGKSSIFELLILLIRGGWRNGLTQFGDLTKVIPDMAEVRIVSNDGASIQDKTYKIRATGKGVVSVDEEPQAVNHPLDIQYFSSEQKEYNYTGDAKKRISSYDPTKPTDPVLSAIDDLAATEITNFATFEVIRSHPGFSAGEPLILSGSKRNEEMSTANLSGGNSALVSMIACVMNNMGSIIVLEEPENGMHVEQQKKIHGWLKKLSAGNDSVQLMVITHSPFLLGNIDESDPETNTYILNEGRVLKSSGYSAKGAKYLASKITGIGFEDIAPQKIVVCEGSLRRLLDIVNGRFYSESIMFASAKSHNGNEASGDLDLLKLAAVEDTYMNRFNFYDKSHMIFVIDQPNMAQKDVKKKLSDVQTKIKSKDTELIVLDEVAIEEYYTNVQGLSGETNIFITDSRNEKKDRAERIANEITLEEFKRVFHELEKVFAF